MPIATQQDIIDHLGNNGTVKRADELWQQK